MLWIRQATADDLPALFDVAWADAKRRAAITEWVGRGEVHLAERDGGVVGYVAFTRSFFLSPFIELLIVAEPARRTGIGRALIQHCIAINDPAEKLWTSTNESNTAMRTLLPQLGFQQTGMFEHLDPGDPELIFLLWPQAAATTDTTPTTTPPITPE